MNVCGRKGCGRQAKYKVNSYPTYYCTFHQKIRWAMMGASKRKKIVPTYEWLEQAFLSTKNCPWCGIALDPFKHLRSTDSRKSGVSTLQHYEDGTMGIICHACNVRSGHSKLGDKVLKLKPNEKHCRQCETIKARSDFHRCYSHADGLNAICKSCHCANNSKRKRKLRKNASKETPGMNKT